MKNKKNYFQKKKSRNLIFSFLVLLSLILISPNHAQEIGARVVVIKADVMIKPGGWEVIATVPIGFIFKPLKKVGDWYCVELPPNEKGEVLTGYIHRIYLAKANHLKRRERKPVEWKSIPEQYVFIDLHVRTHGIAIEGEYQGTQIDFPKYKFNKTEKVLSGNIDFKINEKLKIVLGRGLRLTGVAGGGIATGLYGIYELPFEDNNLAILNVYKDGSVELAYDSKSIILESGESWQQEVSYIDKQEYSMAEVSAKIIETHTIRNYGFLEKSKIIEKDVW
jgi:hypothetical protein